MGGGTSASMHSTFQFLELLGSAVQILPISWESPPMCIQGFCPLKHLSSLRSFFRSYLCVHQAWGTHQAVPSDCLSILGGHPSERITGQSLASHYTSGERRVWGDEVSGSHKLLTFPWAARVEREPDPACAFCTQIQLLGIFDQET